MLSPDRPQNFWGPDVVPKGFGSWCCPKKFWVLALSLEFVGFHHSPQKFWGPEVVSEDFGVLASSPEVLGSRCCPQKRSQRCPQKFWGPGVVPRVSPKVEGTHKGHSPPQDCPHPAGTRMSQDFRIWDFRIWDFGVPGPFPADGILAPPYKLTN